MKCEFGDCTKTPDRTVTVRRGGNGETWTRHMCAECARLARLIYSKATGYDRFEEKEDTR